MCVQSFCTKQKKIAYLSGTPLRVSHCWEMDVRRLDVMWQWLVLRLVGRRRRCIGKDRQENKNRNKTRKKNKYPTVDLEEEAVYQCKYAEVHGDEGEEKEEEEEETWSTESSEAEL